MPLLIFLSTGSELDLQLVSQISTGKTFERGTRKAIFRSVTVYNKHLSSQCNMTAQIEQGYDKKKYIVLPVELFKREDIFACNKAFTGGIHNSMLIPTCSY